MSEDYLSKKNRLKELNSAVKAPIGRLDPSMSKKKSSAGRKRKYTPRRMLNEINKYFEWCEENDEIPSVKGLTLHLKLYASSFYSYMEDPLYADIMSQARLAIVEWLERDVYNTKGMAAGKIGYMKNVHSWSEKIESNNFTETRVINVDEARAKIELLAPMLLDLLKNSTVVNQLAYSKDGSEASIAHKQADKNTVDAEMVEDDK